MNDNGCTATIVVGSAIVMVGGTATIINGGTATIENGGSATNDNYGSTTNNHRGNTNDNGCTATVVIGVSGTIVNGGTATINNGTTNTNDNSGNTNDNGGGATITRMPSKASQKTQGTREQEAAKSCCCMLAIDTYLVPGTRYNDAKKETTAAQKAGDAIDKYLGLLYVVTGTRVRRS